MMRRLLSCLAVTLLVAPLTAHAARAQAAPMPRPANDSLFRRARRLVLDGNGPAGRALVDSLLNVATPGSSAFGDALYWHGALASTLGEAERDYRRVIVEYPLAFYADDALLAIAELEQARGDHAGALAHLQRFVKEHPASPARGIAALGAARLAAEQGDNRVACAMVAEARASVAPGDVELTNQINYFRTRCPATAPATVAKMGSVPTRAAAIADTQSATRTGVPRAMPDSMPATPVTAEIARADTTRRVAAATPVHPAAPAPVTRAPTPVATPTAAPPAPVSAAPRRDTALARPVARTPVPASAPPVTAQAVIAAPPAARNVTPPPRAAASRARITIQLAAYNTRADAEQFAAGLVRRGLQARVSGEAKPFRVRLGYYPTRAAAASEVAALKARGIVSFVAEEPATP